MLEEDVRGKNSAILFGCCGFFLRVFEVVGIAAGAAG